MKVIIAGRCRDSKNRKLAHKRVDGGIGATEVHVHELALRAVLGSGGDVHQLGLERLEVGEGIVNLVHGALVT